AETKETLDSLTEAINDLKEKTEKGFRAVVVELSELKNAIPKATDLANAISDALEGYKTSFFSPLADSVRAIAKSVGDSKTVLESHTKALEKIPGELTKVEGWVNAAVNRLNSEIAKIVASVSALPAQINLLSGKRDEVSGIVSGLEKSLAEQKTLCERLLRETEARVLAEGDVKTAKAEADAKIATELAGARERLASAESKKEELKLLLETFKGIITDLQEKAKSAGIIDVSSIIATINSDKQALLDTLTKMSDALVKASKSKKPEKVINIITDSYNRDSGNGNVVLSGTNALQQSLFSSTEKLSILEKIVQTVMDVKDERAISGVLTKLETTSATVQADVSSASETLVGAEEKIKTEKKQDTV
ncbi:MAG: hypothetical protein Q7K43_00860, partial [Candidatus Woesearchaeota archaeon]|nr:hypothetical protein [Candidatus Woesearchaeota archaeon]